MAKPTTGEEIAAMKKDIQYIKEAVSEIKDSIANMNTNFVTKDQHDTDILRLEKRIGSSSTAKTIITVVATTLITALVLYVFNDVAR